MTARCSLADFLGGMVALAIHQGRSPSGTVRFQLEGWTCLPLSAPTPFNPVFRHRAEVSLPRPRIARADSAGILTGQSICIAVRLIIRVRLTPGRLTSPGNPWSCGGGGSRPPYRYLYLHLLFRTLQSTSRYAFDAYGMLPYRCATHIP